MVVQFVQNLSDGVQPDAGFRRNRVVGGFLQPLQSFDDLHCVVASEEPSHLNEFLTNESQCGQITKRSRFQ